MGSPESKTPAARAASAVWELAQLLKSQDSLDSGADTPPTTKTKGKELFLLTAECLLSGSLTGGREAAANARLLRWVAGGGRAEPVCGSGADDEGGTMLQHNPPQTSSVGYISSKQRWHLHHVCL